MNKQSLFIVIFIVLVSLIGFKVYKSYTYNKIQNEKEAHFDHYMECFYSFLGQYNEAVEIYTRMKKGTILDYIRTGNGRYIDEQVSLYGGGLFSMRHYFYIDQLLSGGLTVHIDLYPIESAPDSRGKERWAFWHIDECGRQLSRIDDYDEKLATNPDYLVSTFNRIDSLANEIHKGIMMLERYKTSMAKGTDTNTHNNIFNPELEFYKY